MTSRPGRQEHSSTGDEQIQRFPASGTSAANDASAVDLKGAYMLAGDNDINITVAEDDL